MWRGGIWGGNEGGGEGDVLEGMAVLGIGKLKLGFRVGWEV